MGGRCWVVSLRAGRLRVDVGGDGWIRALHDEQGGGEYHTADGRSALLSIVRDGRMEGPTTMSGDVPRLTLAYGRTGTRVHVAVGVRATHAVLEVAAIDGPEPEAVVWGPYATTVGDVVGETVGVARSQEIAIGLQALNYWTLAGVPRAFAEPPPAAAGADVRYSYEECAAWPVTGGSLLQAHALSRGADVPPGRLVGSRIALFGCAPSDTLAVIGQIEVREGLPHPMLDGVWGKESATATCSYLITGFSEAAIEEALGYAEAAGLRYMYHGDPFATWGHFALRADLFPQGDEGLRRCAAEAARRGIRLGVHTLTNFITTNDPYVTPVPDPHLQCSGAGRLVTAVAAEAAELEIADPEPFRERGWLGAVVVGGEIIRYGEVSDRPPWRLRGCERGAFGTRASEHEAGSRVGKLADHSYRVLFPDIVLQDKLADRLVELFNAAGLRQISFDGLEGCRATGHPQFAENRFVARCFEGWRDEVISDASLLTHFGWHGHTRMNWGEPWGAAMREGMTEYRFHNQRYFERNLLPAMLGWFLVRSASPEFEATTVDDIEWVLARCAGYGAGCAIVADLPTLRRNGNAEAILRAVRHWEAARLSGAFSAEQRRRLRQVPGEWHLEPVEGHPGRYRMREMRFSAPYTCSSAELQPGQPGGADWRVTNGHAPQPLRFRMRVTARGAEGGSAIIDPGFVVGGRTVIFRGEVTAGSYLVCDGEAEAQVYDQDWRRIRTLRSGAVATLAAGDQKATFSCVFAGGVPSLVSVRFITAGPDEDVGLPH
jgi:hypothetical protein